MRREVVVAGEDMAMDEVEREVEVAVRKFINKKAPGEDGVKAEVIKSLGKEIKIVVAGVVIRKMRGCVPTDMEEGCG